MWWRRRDGGPPGELSARRGVGEAELEPGGRGTPQEPAEGGGPTMSRIMPRPVSVVVGA
jgi:hypothetical protein